MDKFPDKDYLLSAQHTDTLYKISHKDSSIVWRLGGTKSDFEFVGPSAHFLRQHHGRVMTQNETHTVISLFDNAVGDGFDEHPTNDYSRGLIMLLDTVSMKASVITEYRHPRDRRTNARGKNSESTPGALWMSAVLTISKAVFSYYRTGTRSYAGHIRLSFPSIRRTES